MGWMVLRASERLLFPGYKPQLGQNEILHFFPWLTGCFLSTCPDRVAFFLLMMFSFAWALLSHMVLMHTGKWPSTHPESRPASSSFPKILFFLETLGFLPPPRTLFIRAPLYQSSLNKTVSSISYSPDSNGSDLVSHLRFLLPVTRLSGPPCSVPAGTPGDGEFYSWSCARDPVPSGAWCGFELGPLSTCLIVVAESFGFVIWLISWSILCPNQLRISGPAGSDQFCVLCVYAWFVAAVLELKLSSFPLCL